MLTRRSFFGALAAPSLLGRKSGSPGAVTRASEAPAPWPDDSDPRFWDLLRGQFYFPRDEAFFNTSTIGAVPRFVLERVIEDMRTLETTVTRWDYTPRTPNWIAGHSPEPRLREKMGRLVHATGKDIAIIQNAMFGMNCVAHGIDLKAGDEVILTDQEHPGGITGWQLRAKRDGIGR